MHTAVVIFAYFILHHSINNVQIHEVSEREKDEQVRSYESDMEDFLSNISHELRTPVNVVNGMSDLLIKRGTSEAEAIKAAGIRLAHQIENIQDYTECKQQNLILEEENYTSLSLINDVVTVFRDSEDHTVVDLDPAVPSIMYGDIRKLHKIYRHLLDNAVKFTKRGGIYVRMYTESMEYGVNLCIEVTDTGIGMSREAIGSVSEGMYQGDKSRDRSSGGVGLGLFVVYGFVRRMKGFVKIESEQGYGTTVRVTIPQQVVDAKPCLSLTDKFDGNVLFYTRPGKHWEPQCREFYRRMATRLAAGIHVSLFSVETVEDVERMRQKMKVTHIFMGQEEYENDRSVFNELSRGGMTVVVSAQDGYRTDEGSGVLVMPKPLYAYPVIRILNGDMGAEAADTDKNTARPVFNKVKALVVDDEPMNLVVATGLFREYEMTVDTADSGREAIKKFRAGDYDVIFMDHMMPEMDGVEAMKQIRATALDLGKDIVIIALTANVVSGAREMFIKEGFDGFIAKPIDTADFERVMLRVLPEYLIDRGGDRA